MGSSPNVIWGIKVNFDKIGGKCSIYGKVEKYVQVLIGQP
jgi:hypothetical protein